MNYTKVESSQIAEVGYDAETETLGIKFPAGKRSAASEYHYANVPARVHRALITAESIGSYFGKNIKSRADLYPYTRIIPDDVDLTAYADDMKGRPTDPAVASVTRETSGMPTKKEKQQPSLDLDGDAVNGTNSSSTSLSVIDTMADDLLFTPGAVTDEQIAAGRDWYLTEAKKYDITTEKSRTELKRFARPLQKLRTGIEARAKELTGATKRKIAAIDAEKRRLVMLVGGIEDEVLAPLKAYDAAENARIEARNEALKEIQDFGTYTQANWMTLSLDAMRDRLKEIELDTREWPELGELPAKYREESIKQIKGAISAREEYESAQAELEKLRAEKAERDEADRKAEAKRQEDARIAAAAEALAAKKVEDVKAAIREEVISGFNFPSAASIAEMTGEPTQTILAPDNRERAMQEAQVGLFDNCELTVIQSRKVVEAISKGLIPHIRIEY